MRQISQSTSIFTCKFIACLTGSIILLGSLLSGCAPAAETQAENGTTPGNPTSTTMLASTTPEAARPSVSHGLQPVNAASETFENGAWVVKNAAGEVTATWDADANAWAYDMEHIQVVFGGATKPFTDPGNEGMIDKDVTYSVPEEWTLPLPDSQKDPHPFVGLGIINQFDTTHSSSDSEYVMRRVEVGVDFRGITLAEPVRPGRTFDRYVAVFSFTDPSHPDMLYTVTAPILNSPDTSSGFDIYENAPASSTYGIAIDEKNLGRLLSGRDLIDILKDPTSVGRRMVLQFCVPVVGKLNSDNTYIAPNNQLFIDAVRAGKTFPYLETTADSGVIRVPHDLRK